MRPWIIVAVLAATAAGCKSKKAAPAAPAPVEEAPPGATSNPDLVARGGSLYAEKCAGCHGDAGQGTGDGPPVVGADALPLAPRAGQKRDVEFHTAGDVLTWMSANMPAKEPGTLAPDDYLAILAFDLSANGVELGDEPLTAERAAQIMLHP